MSLKVSTRRTDGCSVVRADGELDLLTAGRLRYRLARELRDCRTPVVADLRGVTFCDAAGLGALVDAHNTARRLSVRLPVVVEPAGRVLRLLRLTELDSLLELYGAVPDAVAGLEPADRGPEHARASALPGREGS